MPGIEARVSSICWCSWNNIAMLCAHLGFIVHTLCHYCEMIVTAAKLQVKNASSTFSINKYILLIPFDSNLFTSTAIVLLL